MAVLTKVAVHVGGTGVTPFLPPLTQHSKLERKPSVTKRLHKFREEMQHCMEVHGFPQATLFGFQTNDDDFTQVARSKLVSQSPHSRILCKSIEN